MKKGTQAMLVLITMFFASTILISSAFAGLCWNGPWYPSNEVNTRICRPSNDNYWNCLRVETGSACRSDSHCRGHDICDSDHRNDGCGTCKRNPYHDPCTDPDSDNSSNGCLGSSCSYSSAAATCQSGLMCFNERGIAPKGNEIGKCLKPGSIEARPYFNEVLENLRDGYFVTHGTMHDDGFELSALTYNDFVDDYFMKAIFKLSGPDGAVSFSSNIVVSEHYTTAEKIISYNQLIPGGRYYISLYLKDLNNRTHLIKEGVIPITIPDIESITRSLRNRASSNKIIEVSVGEEKTTIKLIYKNVRAKHIISPMAMMNVYSQNPDSESKLNKKIKFSDIALMTQEPMPDRPLSRQTVFTKIINNDKFAKGENYIVELHILTTDILDRVMVESFEFKPIFPVDLTRQIDPPLSVQINQFNQFEVAPSEEVAVAINTTLNTTAIIMEPVNIDLQTLEFKLKELNLPLNIIDKSTNDSSDNNSEYELYIENAIPENKKDNSTSAQDDANNATSVGCELSSTAQTPFMIIFLASALFAIFRKRR